MFDPDYRKSPWNHSKYAPRNSGSRSKNGKGNAITSRAALIALAITSPLWCIGVMDANTTILITTFLMFGVLFAGSGVIIQRSEYARLTEGSESNGQPEQQESVREPISWWLFAVFIIIAPPAILLALLFGVATIVSITEGMFGAAIMGAIITAVTGAIGKATGERIIHRLRNRSYSSANTPDDDENFQNSHQSSYSVVRDPHEQYKRPVSRRSSNSDIEMPPSLRNIDYSTLDPTVFEEEVAWLINTMTDQEAQVVGGSGDGGVDIEVFNPNGKLVGIVQCKRYDPSRALPPSFVRELFAVKHRYDVKTAYLATTAYFTDATRQEAEELDIRLMDGDTIRRMQKQAHAHFFNHEATDAG